MLKKKKEINKWERTRSWKTLLLDLAGLISPTKHTNPRDLIGWAPAWSEVIRVPFVIYCRAVALSSSVEESAESPLLTQTWHNYGEEQDVLCLQQTKRNNGENGRAFSPQTPRYWRGKAMHSFQLVVLVLHKELLVQSHNFTFTYQKWEYQIITQNVDRFWVFCVFARMSGL